MVAFGNADSATGQTSTFGAAIIDILDYTSTNKYRTTKVLTGYDDNSSGTVQLLSSLYKNSTAITSLTFANEYSSLGYNLAEYSSFALYGVK